MHAACRAFVLAAVASATAASLGAQQTPSQPPPLPDCSDAVHHQFDFWIGEWDVLDSSGTRRGVNSVQPILNGCALHERWRGADGDIGESFSAYDRLTKQWHQTWVDGIGNVWKTDGGLVNGAMVLTRTGPLLRAPIDSLRHRWTWTRIDDRHVRQVGEVSRDGGKTWRVLFDGRYVRRPSSSG